MTKISLIPRNKLFEFEVKNENEKSLDNNIMKNKLYILDPLAQVYPYC